MSTIKIKQIDAFTTVPFGGNPAGVVTDANNLDDELKQKIACEMNLSETAFVSHSGVADFKVQFFTPNAEVDLCGHATIATFAALYEEGKLDTTKSIFYQETKAGVLPVEVSSVAGETVFMMTQAVPQFEKISIDKAEVASALGMVADDLLDTPVMKVSTGIWWLIVGVRKLATLYQSKPNLAAIRELSAKHQFVGIIPFCLDTVNPKFSFHLRAFCPLVGINEDPICGTGNGCVAAFIAFNQLIDFENEISLMGEEGLEVNRPGSVYIYVGKKQNDILTIKVGGTARTILEGEMRF
jgi:PhzF family phenazine biosynthesis protein